MVIGPLVQLKISNGVCAGIAICTTCTRLWMRRGRYWWDDGFALFSMVFQLLQIGAVFLHVPDPSVFSRTTNVAAYYIMAATFYCIIWMARLSILFSIIRIDSNQRRTHILRWTAGLFGLVLVVMICQLFWVCEPLGGTWKNERSPQCPLDQQVAICQLVTDILSDTLLLVVPLRLLSAMSADDSTRRRLMFIFSTSIVTTVVSLVHAALIFEDAGIKVVIAAMVENGVSLMVCNVPVLATAFIRAMGRHDSSDTDDPDDSAANTYLKFGSKLRFSTSVFKKSAGGGGTTTTTFGWGGKSRGGVSTRAITLTGLSSVTEDSTRDEGKDEYAQTRTVDLPAAVGTRTVDFGTRTAREDQKVAWVDVPVPDRGAP
ncbi:hypothetical protein PUNSTDRAFT_128715 [Punctularia strigosozonata HHB-11173 SS5]|uniref:Rhodopsin domain-containing protein n=1 Tax=Punctularia strigosozonata (strain HHB-11173) TaxID=741275 RepID=R7RZL3_PUNST|nr:uncharacterized protein PUNSTDRAFT_128715 [Punctularia strigosozonata HHB-11173 SS5]EIN03555.1 hypothetical protein PUNSTDRAFT_128715 [Punctularia strigosozonata HHB-11173 SS5]